MFSAARSELTQYLLPALETSPNLSLDFRTKCLLSLGGTMCLQAVLKFLHRIFLSMEYCAPIFPFKASILTVSLENSPS